MVLLFIYLFTASLRICKYALTWGLEFLGGLMNFQLASLRTKWYVFFLCQSSSVYMEVMISTEKREKKKEMRPVMLWIFSFAFVAPKESSVLISFCFIQLLRENSNTRIASIST